MNPFSFYEHKPQLIASTIAGVASIVVLRRRVVGAPRVAAISGAAWGGIGWLDWFVYSFGYSLASWTHRDTTAIGEVLEWFRVPIVALIALALAGAARGAPDRNRGS